MAKTVKRAMLWTKVGDFNPCETKIVKLDHHPQVGRCEHKKVYKCFENCNAWWIGTLKKAFYDPYN